MNYLKKSAILLVAALSFSGAAQAEAPAGYYSSCEGKSGAALLTALNSVVGNPNVLSYNGLWTLYKTSDVRSNGYIWDMYSTSQYTPGRNQCGSYSGVGSCYNREHSFPKSWFNDQKPMYSDAYHLYPTDGAVNGQRSNYPFGECANGTYLRSNGSVKPLGRLGSSTFPGYSGTVFEPDDEYKGDFARTYFYMAAAYNTRISSWNSAMLAHNSYPAFSSWAVNLLLKWHRQDPVSEKEIKRNDVVSRNQGNRNPFIDYPELAEYIWGDRIGTGWTPGGIANPTLNQPVDGSTLDLGATVAGYPRSATLNVRGAALEGNVTFSVDNADFSVSPATVTKAAAESGTSVTVTYNPASAGAHAAVLTVKSGSLTSRVNLKGSAISSLPAGPVTTYDDCSFVATWSNVGDADANGQYTLNVCLDGEPIDGYPMSVDAADEQFLVEDLQPLTEYTYTVSSERLHSDAVKVTTMAPLPRVIFLFDGELYFTAEPGEPSEAAELLVFIENISEPLKVEVAEPFELSTDKSAWSRSISLDPEEDRLYLRLNSAAAGSFRTSIVATSGDYRNDDAEAEGYVAVALAFHEDFEPVDKNVSSYSPPTYQGTACQWNMTDAGIWPSDKAYQGDQAVRMGRTTSSTITAVEDHHGGIGTVSIWTAYFNADGNATYELEYSTDGGQIWQSAGTGNVTSSTYAEQTFTVNVAADARLRVRQTSGKRFMLDEISATKYSNLVPDAVADYHRWDAYSRDGQLVIEAAEAVSATVYGLDGATVFAAQISAGETVLTLAPGLYIVSVDDFARRVLVK